MVARVSPVTQPVPWIRIHDVRYCEDRKSITGEERGQEICTGIVTCTKYSAEGAPYPVDTRRSRLDVSVVVIHRVQDLRLLQDLPQGCVVD